MIVGSLPGRTLPFLFLFALTGCLAPPGAPGPTQTRLSPVLERQRGTYAELKSGRFISLADFETPGQEALFRVVTSTGGIGAEQPGLSILRSRNETGAGGLKVVLRAPGEELRCDGQRSPDRALLRDWRPYALLLLSIHSDAPATLEFAIESGVASPLRWSRTLAVQAGWNLFRIDLATVGDWIDLGDVRALVWCAPDVQGVVALHLDDLILADNSAPVLGTSDAADALYVTARGRRLLVGVGGRFELAFRDGVIVGWRSGSDENLADRDGLGPWPVPLPDDWAVRPDLALAYDDPQLFAAWGAGAAATQRVEEATPFRVVITGEWQFARPATPTTAESGAAGEPPAAGHQWRYVVYPNGAVYVLTRSRAPAAGWSTNLVGYAVGLDGRREFQRVEPPGRNASGAAPEFVLCARPGRERGDLLWSWPPEAGLHQQRALETVDGRRLAVLAGDVAAGQTVEAAHLLRVWPPDLEGVPEATSLAADFRTPGTLTFRAGALRRDLPGDLNGDGYNEAEGCYELALEGGAVRFEFDPGQPLRFEPVFRVHDTRERRCWVYARGRLADDTGRDADGNLLVRLGRIAGGRVMIEVHSANELHE